MTYFQALFLAAIQGLTEFLPVSSSGHLVIFQKLFGLAPPVFFDVAVHVGTFGAILVYFRRELAGLVRYPGLVRLIFISSFPAAVVGFLLQSRVETIFGSLPLVGASLLVTAALLFSTHFLRTLPRCEEKHTLEVCKSTPLRWWKNISWSTALFVGLAQAFAILPGVSRSGATISVGLHRGLSRELAFRFSFFLAIPAIFGALVLQLPDLVTGQFNYLNQALLGAIISGIIGYLSLRLLERALRSAKLWWFGVYCLVLGVALFSLSI